MWMWESTRPGRMAASPKSCTAVCGGTSSGATTALMRSSSTRTAAGRTPSGVTTRREANAAEIMQTKIRTRGDSREADWLGGLDSNQDSQIQSLESYQLDDLPTDGCAAL